MENLDRLTSLIFSHWRNFHPQMVEQFRKENRLEEELQATVERFTDLLYHLLIVEKMSYPAAWEMTIHQILQPGEESSLLNPNQSGSPPATSG